MTALYREERRIQKMGRIILASASPRRAELLKKAGVTFTVVTADTDERTDQTEPAAVVTDLARDKAEAVRKKLEKNSGKPAAWTGIILAADTIVARDGCILGKPRDAEDAVRMLTTLQGRWHQVYTGVCLLIREREGEEFRRLSFSECTQVEFYPVEEERIRRYAASGEPLDKAGAYAIQGLWMANVKGIRGDYSNVVGLPVSRLAYETRLHGIDLGMI